MWKPRKQRKCIGRIVYSTPASGERYFLWMLLNVVRGPRTSEELLTINKRLCTTFKEACFAYGLLNDDREWARAIQEASLWALGPQLRDLFIWDYASMTGKYAFEALNKTLRDILGKTTSENRNKIFGGLTVLLGGDFRQILPVIPKGKRADIVQACINRSVLWKHCKVFTLTRSMRVNEYYANGEIDTRKQDFNQWVLAVGNGNLLVKMKDGEDEPTWIEILEKFLINSLNSPIEQIVAETYPNFIERQRDDAYLRERAILTPRNDDADAINAYMFDKLEGESVTYNSADEICENPNRVKRGRHSNYTQDHIDFDAVQMALCPETATVPSQAMLCNDD
ncbi:ATP-dependent DNA helicase PIF1-like protein [Tanacetum coccineum]